MLLLLVVLVVLGGATPAAGCDADLRLQEGMLKQATHMPEAMAGICHGLRWACSC
jgi:hypothetical protein